jgi:hypothetical protein
VPEATTLAWAGDSSLAVGQGLAGLSEGAAEQGPGGAHVAGGGAGTQAQAGPQPAGGGGGLEALVGAGGPAGVDGRGGVEPVAFQAVQQPQLEDLPGGDRVGQAVQVLAGQLLDGRGQGGQPVWSSGRRPGRLGGRLPGAVPGLLAGAVSDRLPGHMLGGVPGRVAGGRAGRLPVRMCVRVHGGNLSSPQQKASTQPQSGDNRSGFFTHQAKQLR